jgi:signal transduction histidine kinase
MKNRLLPYLVVSIILVVLAVMVDRSYKDTKLLQQYADQISVYTSSQMGEAQSWVDGHTGLLQRFVDIPDDGNAGMSERLRLSDKPYTIVLHKRDSLLFWSNNKYIPSGYFLAELAKKQETFLYQLPLGYFSAKSAPLDDVSVSILVPVRYDLETDLEQAYTFPADPGIPKNVVVSAETGDAALMVSGKQLAWLQASGSVQPVWVQLLKLFAYGVLFILICIGINQLGIKLAERVHPGLGIAVVASAIAGFWFANGSFGLLKTAFNRLPLMHPEFPQETPLGTVPGDWLLYCGLALWGAVFFHRVIPTPSRKPGAGIGIALSVGVYVGLMLSVLLAVYVFNHLVLRSGIDFNFGNILNLNEASFSALASIILFMSSLFLVGHRLMLLVRSMELKTLQRIGSQLGAVMIFLLISLALPVPLGIMYLLGFGLLYALLFDYFIHWEDPGFGWVVVWLLLFTMFSSFLLNRYNQEKDQETRKTYAALLAQERDVEEAEPILLDMQKTVEGSEELSYLLKPWPFKPGRERLNQYFNSFAFHSGYLFEHYRLRLFAFDSERQPLLIEQTTSWDELVSTQWEKALPIDGAPSIRYFIDDLGVFKYLLRFRKNRMEDPSQPADVFVVYEQEFSQAARVYEQLFFTHPYKKMDGLSQYDFSVWRDGKLLVEHGETALSAVNAPVVKGEVREIYTEQPARQDAVSKSVSGKSVAVVGHPVAAWYRQVYLFAILFALSSLGLFGMALLNPLLRLLPDYFEFQLSTKGSLSRRIHYWNIALIVVAFLVLGIMTYSHFNTSAARADRATFDYRANAVLVHLRNQFGDVSPSSDSLGSALVEVLGPLTSSLSLDVNLFSPSGNMLFSSRNDLRELGLIPEKLSAGTLELLRSQPQGALENEEVLGGEPYLNRYQILRNSKNELLGYLSIPYRFSNRTIGPEVSDFMGMLASLYVFLLLIAGTATLALARSIIRPVRLISDKIKELKFEDKNQPLEYQGDTSDELGELIEEYNRMVDKLEDSKVQLIRMEKEGAWREMARQIAHDIKNPLTTMKLSMQQLQRVSDDPMQAAAYLKKAITRLIEQIDSLAQIASEFSMFANLDIRQRSDLILNDVVESVYDLFTEQKDVQLALKLPQKRMHINGDKNHLIRVFNNLVINAIQAIPEDRLGKIEVSLYQAGEDAIVKISDNGGGIPEDIQKRVFEPNFTTKSSGSGLGLAICRRIIEELDGNIRFDTRITEGTDFYIKFPITQIEEPEAV